MSLSYLHDNNIGFDICDEDLDEDDQFKDDPICLIDVKVVNILEYVKFCQYAVTDPYFILSAVDYQHSFVIMHCFKNKTSLMCQIKELRMYSC